MNWAMAQMRPVRLGIEVRFFRHDEIGNRLPSRGAATGSMKIESFDLGISQSPRNASSYPISFFLLLVIVASQ